MADMTRFADACENPFANGTEGDEADNPIEGLRP